MKIIKTKNYYYNKKNPKCKDMELTKKGYPVYKDSKKPVHKYLAKKYLNENEPLKDWEEVHHVDGDKLNYSPDNLIILSKKDHWKISTRLHKERNLNRANAFVFFLILALFLKENTNNIGVLDSIIGILLIIGILISVYPNIASWIMKKTKLYKIIGDDLDSK